MKIDREAYPEIHPKLKILVIDDSPITRNALKGILSDLGFKKISLAASSEEALKKVETNVNKKDPFEIIFCDINLPGGDSGLGFLKEVKMKPFFNDLKVIINSSSDDGNDMVEAIENGALGFIRKPCTEKAVIQNLINAFNASKE